jgi:hypothetical protein
MASAGSDFVTVDMRGLKAALVERARSDGISVSALVRGAVAARLGLEPAISEKVRVQQSTVRLSVRLSPSDASRLQANAAEAGLSRGSYLGQLMASTQPLLGAAERSALTDAIVSSNKEVSALNRNVRHLTELLSRGSVRAAQEYRAMLDTVAVDVRRHLALVGAGLRVLLTASRQGGRAVRLEKELT